MHEAPVIALAGIRVDLSIVLMLVVTCTIVFVIAKLATRNLSVENPGKLQNFMEWVVEFVQNMISSTMDWKKGKPFLSLAMTMIMFIFVANLLGLPFGVVTEYHDPADAKIFGHEITTVTDKLHEEQAAHPEETAEAEVAWWKSPTADVSVTMGLALLVFLLSHGLGLVKNTKNYLKHYFEPYPIFFPINLIETLSKFVTHGIRLFANIFAGEVLIGTIMTLAKAGVVGMIFSIPLMMAWQGFSLFIGAIQAFVFVILMMVYISQTLQTHDEEHH
ncbi:F0F1 ATP synthase subunit A [Paenibacillus sp. D2_2]|uniref:F0F1 ATP synthase subunit A n=1 Tax=Paenibacillus sp. D2_2 TaxID=3073092 RepID=UPI00281608F5|nr:F0F1 ATP synthase subunit A [Paenibacillus sp. D2_2]WMT40709.1 F0F1 ATP synthase subunit A [Paenibacillus sp. D2_2]